MAAAIVLVVWLAVLAALVLLTWKACRRAWQERQASSKAALPAAANAALGAVIAVLGTSVGLAQGVGVLAGEGADPSRKAFTLGQGIADAMNYTALGFVIWLPSFIVLSLVKRRGSKTRA